MKINRVERELGQGLVEYALVLVLVAIVAILAMQSLTNSIHFAIDQAELELTNSANRDSSSQALQLLQDLRVEIKRTDEDIAEAQNGLVEFVTATAELFRELGSAAGVAAADKLVEFTLAVEAGDRGRALEIVESSDWGQISIVLDIPPSESQRFMERQAPGLFRSCQYLHEASVTDEFYQIYEETRKHFEEDLPDKDQALELLEEVRNKVEAREGLRGLESDILAICEE